MIFGKRRKKKREHVVLSQYLLKVLITRQTAERTVTAYLKHIAVNSSLQGRIRSSDNIQLIYIILMDPYEIELIESLSDIRGVQEADLMECID